MDQDVPVTENRRLEVVVDGLPLRGGAQLAVDTTLVCALCADGTPRRGAAASDGVALKAVRRRKVATHPPPQLSQACRGGWGAVVKRETLFPESVGSCTCEARMRWGTMLACIAAKAVASSLLHLPHSHGADGKAPSTGFGHLV